MYVLQWSVALHWAPDGAQQETVPNAQALTLSNFGGTNFQGPGTILVPGGNAPTQANILTAVGQITAAITPGIAANLAAIQGWASGGD